MALASPSAAPSALHHQPAFPSSGGLEGDVWEGGCSWRQLNSRQLRSPRWQITSLRCSMKVTANSEQERPRSRVVTKAVPVAVSAAVTLAVVGAAVVAISKREKSPALPETNKTECEDCKGSGLCPSCNGEGFLLKNLSKEAAAKARAKAADAATRYTAGLAKKWSYCGTCSGSRGCLTCEGRGWLKKDKL